MAAVKDFRGLIGQSVDRLDLATREAVVGKVVAQQLYTPDNLALQRIAAIGDSVKDCAQQLEANGCAPLDYDSPRLTPPFLAR